MRTIPLALAMTFTLGCSSGGGFSGFTGGKVCVAGVQIACACGGGKTGAQTCKEDGSGYGDCTGCGGIDQGSPDLGVGPVGGDVTSAHGEFHKFVMSTIQLPQSRAEFGIDLNGDAKTDNQYGNIIGALAAQGSDPQKAIDDAIAGGSLIELVSFQTIDADLANDTTAGATLLAGRETSNPDFSGFGRFTVDGSQAPGSFFGVLAGTRFSSNNPITTKIPVSVHLRMPFFIGADPVDLPIHGAHIEFNTGVNGNFLDGELHGSIKKTDIQTVVVPQIATLLTAEIERDPFSQTAQQIQALFDTGGCGGAFANDGRIDSCEVAGNPIVMNVLAPDVQIYDAAGNYAPNRANTTKDSLSIGFRFSAVGAVY